MINVVKELLFFCFVCFRINMETMAMIARYQNDTMLQNVRLKFDCTFTLHNNLRIYSIYLLE